jgi:hypothetical protein
MKLEMSNFQAVAANLTVQGEICDLPHAALAPLTVTPTEIVPLIQKSEPPRLKKSTGCLLSCSWRGIVAIRVRTS